jgi:hypothetical protein
MREIGSRQVAMMRAARSQQGVFDAVAQGNNYHAAMRLAERGLFARVPFRTYVFTLTDAGERRLAYFEAAE